MHPYARDGAVVGQDYARRGLRSLFIFFGVLGGFHGQPPPRLGCRAPGAVIGDWDVSSVTNMERMFYKARKFNQDLTGWQVGQITETNYCKRFCMLSKLKKNNALSLPKQCLKGC